MNVFWSDRLERLSEGLFEQWESGPAKDPFARTCVVVGDMATRNWLKRYFLLQRTGGKRKILANIDFVPLAEFVNDWLAAVTHTAGTDERKASEHPYAQGVLTWRINAILKDHEDDPELAVLRNYVSGKTAKIANRRRYELAARLAQLYDDYLASRYRMLVRWENGELPAGDERWQAVLYRLLVQEIPGTYAKDFDAALGDSLDAGVAFGNGFPKYEAVHVFDVPTCPWPYMLMLRKLAEKLPTTFWNFNPSRAYWGDDTARCQAAQEAARQIREALQKGENPPESAPELMFDTPDAKLLGSLASGAKGMLAAELDLAGADCRWCGAEAEPAFATLKSVSTEVHACYSPRRELEAARDALHRFFAETKGTRPSDALVLCADWATYSPLIESVFSSSGTDSIPIALDGGVADDTPITHSFGEIFDFRTNRFEVSGVFNLLSVLQVRTKFGIDADAFTMLRDMVQKNNIHWGFDDADVKDSLGPRAKDEPRPFTWQRGLDRFVADVLLGPRPDERDLVDLGGLGRLQPCGRVEDDRAAGLVGLWSFVHALKDVRAFLKGSHAVEEWRDRLLKIVDDFYAVDTESVGEISELRQAVMSVTADVMIARDCGKASSAKDPIPGDVMCRAVLAAVGGRTRKVESFGDCVRFAPLRNGSAVPAKFVWICGLNDGAFPRTEYPPAFDIVGQHPTMFDTSSRARDGLALLKAAMGARERLAFSYVGQSVKTNDKVPASVALIDLQEWFKASGVNVTEYRHPLQAYSPRYYLDAADDEERLPPSYSEVNHAAAVAIASPRVDKDEMAIKVRPFTFAEKGDTVIDLDELIGFYCRPNHFVATQRLHFRISRSRYDLLNDADQMGVEVSDGFVVDALLAGSASVEQIQTEAERMVEAGAAYRLNLAKDALMERLDEEAFKRVHTRRIMFAKSDPEFGSYACPGEDLAARYQEYAGGEPEAFNVRLKKSTVVVFSALPAVGLENADGGRTPHVFAYGHPLWPSDFDAAWIRHLALHAAGRECVTVLYDPMDDKAVKTYRPVPKAEALRRLRAIVEKATEEFTLDMDKARGKDGLPPDYEELLDSYGFCFYKGKRWNRG